MSEWQHICTAPMDGTRIIGLYDRTGEEVELWYEPSSGHWRNDDDGPTMRHYPSHWRPKDQATPNSVDLPPSMLDEAKKLVYGQRQADYGPALKNFQDIADIWTVVLGVPVTPKQVSLCMIGLKMARVAKSPDHRDSWIDIAGYVACVDKMERGE